MHMHVKRTEHQLETGRRLLATTAVRAFELLCGARTQEEKEKVRKLLAAMRVFAFDPLAAEASADSRRSLEAVGRSIGIADCLIAGICLDRGADLLTRNREPFGRVSGLRLERLDASG